MTDASSKATQFPRMAFKIMPDDGSECDTRFVEISRIPVVGEFVTLESAGTKYRVTCIIHVPFANADSSAEVYAIEVSEKYLMDAIRSRPMT
jgi:hypothetical protein